MIARRSRRALAVALCTMLLAGQALAQGEDQRIWVRFGENPNPTRPTAPIDTLWGIVVALRQCWSPPPLGAERTVDVGFHISFKRSGELFGKPRSVMFAHELSQERRDKYYQAVAEALDRCANLPFTDSLGGAVAGRKLRVLLIDMRNKTQRQVLLHD